MTSGSNWELFGTEDANGFRSFSMHADGKDHTKVSVHFGEIKDYLARTGSDLSRYSEAELKSLKTAAALLAAKAPPDVFARAVKERSVSEVSDSTMQELLKGANDIVPRSFEKYFPGLAVLALQMASDVCLKKALNTVVEGFNAPAVTTEKSVEIIFDDFRKVAKSLLVSAGRRLESTELLTDVQEALRRIRMKGGKTPTQEKLAEMLDIEPRTLRARQSNYGIETHAELLRACGWIEETNGP